MRTKRLMKRRLSSGRWIAFSAVLGVVAVAPARASLVIALDMPTMVERADHVAVVDVASVTAAWDENHERILTTVELSVVESWKGPTTPAARIKVVQPGGAVGDITMVVSGMSRFTPGERALVFLRGSAANASVVGMAQGKRLIRRDLASGRWMVHVPDPAGASFVRAAPSPSTPPVFDTRVRAVDELRAEIRDLVVKAKAR
jgi:hypothetical protein